MWALVGVILAQGAAQPSVRAPAQAPDRASSANGAVQPASPDQGSPAPPPQPGPAPGQPASGVVSYPASFFAAFQCANASEMISRLPGFVLDSGDSVRGFAGAAGNVLIDGLQPSSKNDSLDSVLRRIPASQIDHVDLIRGGAAGIDMRGKTVLANVVRTKGAATTGLIALVNQWSLQDGRQFPGLRLEGTHRSGDQLWEGSAVLVGGMDDGAGDGSRTLARPGQGLIGTAQDNGRGQVAQFTSTAAHERPLFGGQLRVNAQLFAQKYTADELVNPLSGTAIASQFEHDRQNREEAEFGLHYNRAFAPGVGGETILLQNLKGEDFLSLFNVPGETDRFREQHSNGETIARQVFTWTATPKLTVEAGAEGDYNWQVSHTRFAVNGAPVTIPAANVTVTEARGEGFAKATWQATPKLSVEAGLRLEASRIASSGDVTLQKTLIFPKPRLFVSWSPTADDQLRFRVEREVGQLDFGDFAASSSLSTGQILAGNPDLNPQEAWVVEGAWEHRFWKTGAAVITLRHSELSDVIDRVPIFAASGSFDAPGNIGSGTKDELIASISLPLGPLGLKGGLLTNQATLRGSSVKDPVTGQDRAISGLRPLVGQSELSQDLPAHHLKWGASLYYGFRQRYYRLSQIETDVFAPIVTLYAEWRARPDVTFRWELQELNNSFDRELRNYTGPRDRTTIDTVEERRLAVGPSIYARIRKTF